MRFDCHDVVIYWQEPGAPSTSSPIDLYENSVGRNRKHTVLQNARLDPLANNYSN